MTLMPLINQKKIDKTIESKDASATDELKYIATTDDAATTDESKDIAKTDKSKDAFTTDELKDIATTDDAASTDESKDITKIDESKNASATDIKIQDNPSYDTSTV